MDMQKSIKCKFKKHLSFTSLLHGVSKLLRSLPDNRSGTYYSIYDSVMSGFACMYFQEPSLVQFQKSFQEAHKQNNLHTIFDISNIPEDTQIRKVIDSVSSDTFKPTFKDCFSRLQRGKHLEQYQVFKDKYLCSIDGTQYFSSQQISCNSCLTTTHVDKKTKEESTTYSHKVLHRIGNLIISVILLNT